MAHVARGLGILCLLAVVCPSLAPGAQADKAAEVFDSVYGADLKRAKGTRDTTDDLELATRLLAAAKDATRQPEFLTVLCEKAFDLTSGYPDGHATAVKAMETLATAVPTKVIWCTEQVVGLLQKQFTAARGDDRAKAGEELIVALLALADLKRDAGAPTEAVALLRRAEQVARAVKSDRLAEIDERQKALASSLRAAREAESLKALLEKNPQNASAREKLVRLYLVDMDNPAEAARHVEGVADKSLRKYVPAAAKDTEAAPELACKELGEWYRDLATEAPPGAKAAMYARARAYYERFLQVHTAEDLDRTAVTLVLKKVKDAMAKLGPPPSDAPGPWINLLKLIDPAKHVVAGKWQRNRDGALQAGGGQGVRAFVPCTVEGGYEMTVTFARPKSELDVAVIIPVGSTGVALCLSAGIGGSHDLRDASTGPTRVTPGTLDNSQDHTVAVKVLPSGDQAEVVIHLDGKPLFHWQGAQSALSVSPGYKLPHAKCLGIGSHFTTVVFKALRLRTLGGKVKLLR